MEIIFVLFFTEREREGEFRFFISPLAVGLKFQQSVIAFVRREKAKWKRKQTNSVENNANPEYAFNAPSGRRTAKRSPMCWTGIPVH